MLSNPYLFERITGAFVYCGLLLLFVLCIQRTSDIIKLKKVLYTYAFSLSIMAFFYIPSKEADITRLLSMGNIWVNQGPRVFFSEVLWTTSCPIAYLLIYLCSLSGVPGLLSFVAAIVYYYNTFYVIWIIGKEKRQYSSRVISILVLFVMSSSSFISVISGIRSAMAFSIIIRCFFDEIYNNKKIYKNIVFYLISVFLHSISIPLVLVRLFSLAFSKTKNRHNKVLQLILIVFLLFVLFRFGGIYINGAIDKFEIYTSTVTYLNNRYYIATVFRLLIYIILTIKHLKLRNKHYSETGYNMFLISISIIELVLIGNFVIMGRLVGFFSLLILPVISDYICRTPVHKNTIDYPTNESVVFGIIAERNLVIICFVLIISAYLVGDLSAYKFFVL